ncbi:MAG: hypothetical protein LKE89_04900 [Lactobacillaceae bacterium]|jgi:hypothetical protein|nr:hypothetical protein [Lactobacillaceae bacterium]
MKKIAFVLYNSQVASYTYFNGVMSSKKLEKKLHEVFDADYQIEFKWDVAQDLDALVVPDPSAPFNDPRQLPQIKVPAKLFYEDGVVAIKKIVDDYFQAS